MGSGREEESSQSPEPGGALQLFAGTVKPLPTESGVARLAAVQGGGSQS